MNKITASPGQTKKLGAKLARQILKTPLKKGAILIGLQGNLGSGKTTFLQGFAKGLGIRERVLSPTFVIFRKFQIPKSPATRDPAKRDKIQIKSKIQNPKFLYFYHIDCYRLKGPGELLLLGFEEIISNPKNIVAIEWPERIKRILPKAAPILKFKFLDEKTRKIIL